MAKKSSKKEDALDQIGFERDEDRKAGGVAVSKPKPKVKETSHEGMKCFGACNEAEKPKHMNEHDKITSRTTGRKHEISMGPQFGSMVPKNPFASLAQEGFLHAHPEKLGAKKLAEFDAATKGMKLPKKVKK